MQTFIDENKNEKNIDNTLIIPKISKENKKTEIFKYKFDDDISVLKDLLISSKMQGR